MAARAVGDQDQSVHARLGRLSRMSDVGDVVKDLTAIAMDGVHHVAHRAQGGDDQRHLLLDRHRQVGHQPGIGRVDDVIDAEGGGLGFQAAANLMNPFPIALCRALVQGREGADDAGVARLDHQVRAGHEEHRRRNDRQGQALLQRSGNGHERLLGFLSIRLAGCRRGRQMVRRRGAGWAKTESEQSEESNQSEQSDRRDARGGILSPFATGARRWAVVLDKLWKRRDSFRGFGRAD